MLMPYGSKHNQSMVAKVGGSKEPMLLPYGSVRHSNLIAKAGVQKLGETAEPRKRRVVRLIARG